MERLVRGQLAPDFEATTYRGERIALRDFRGHKLLLSFFRNSSCMFCNYRIHQLAARQSELSAAGIVVLGVMESSAEEIARYAGHNHPSLPIVADPDRTLYHLYGVRSDPWGVVSLRISITFLRAIFAGYFPKLVQPPSATIPIDVLVDPEGLVWEAHYGTDFADHVPFERLFTFAADSCLDLPQSTGA